MKGKWNKELKCYVLKDIIEQTPEEIEAIRLKLKKHNTKQRKRVRNERGELVLRFNKKRITTLYLWQCFIEYQAERNKKANKKPFSKSGNPPNKYRYIFNKDTHKWSRQKI